MRRVFLLGLLLACGGPQPAPVVVHMPAPLASSSASVVASGTLPAAPPVRRRVVPPETNGCLVHAERPHAPRALRGRPDDTTAYATVEATDDERVLFYKGGTVPYVELETADGGLRLRGYADLPLHAAKPFALAGVIVPKKRARLSWRGTTDDGHVTVALALPAAVTVDGGHLVSGLAPCDAMTVLADDTWAERADEQPANPVSLGKLTLGVRSEPGGAVRATVDLADDTLFLGEVRGGFRRIDVPFDDFNLRGWVPAKLPASQSMGTIGLGHAGVGGQRMTKYGSPACEAPLVVYAKTGEAFLEVGTVGAGFPVKLAQAFGEYARIDIGEGSAAGKLPWFARTADIEACHARSFGSGWRFE